jgi:fatty acid desaturase
VRYSHIISVCRLYTHTHSRLSFSAVTLFLCSSRGWRRDPPRETVDGPSQVLLLFFFIFSLSRRLLLLLASFFSVCSYVLTSVCLFFWRFLLFWLLIFFISLYPASRSIRYNTILCEPSSNSRHFPVYMLLCGAVALHTRHRRTFCVTLVLSDWSL